MKQHLRTGLRILLAAAGCGLIGVSAASLGEQLCVPRIPDSQPASRATNPRAVRADYLEARLGPAAATHATPERGAGYYDTARTAALQLIAMELHELNAQLRQQARCQVLDR